MEQKVENIKIEGAQLIFKNFSGKVSQYNKDGDRTVGVLLPDEIAANAEAVGWNVKYLKPRKDDPTEYRQPYLPTKICWKFYPPKVELIDSFGRTPLVEETIDQLDWLDIQNVDIVIRPYRYASINGNPPGIAAYIKSLYVTVNDDGFEEKYGDLPYRM